ncbi:zinc-ribbon domain-containing protein [Methylobacterium sp. J-048]|uniref:zinc-ribbon domain-containing protein n=1 Tax=Methylobacterium sp. J-048 TaxID=2836635 RepID=UPI001FBAD9C3|nr:zinc-ribbon domain-containing protein [Methylobacterium sp. J-048]MCJ2057709.1 zinc-ribbon domain-containing protein [Methylobacterium sp. J-048]
MLIVCPSCASEYRIDAGKVGMDGRSVRCAACRETWFLTPADVLAGHEAELAEKGEAEPDPVADAAWQEATATVRAATDTSEPPPARRRVPARPSRGNSRRGIVGLSPSLAVGLTLLAALPLICLARTSVVRVVPQTAALFARVGLPVNVRGIEIRDVVAFSSPAEDGRPPELVIEGDLVGIARTDVPVSALSVEIRDAAGRALRTFPVAPPRAVLGTAETARFRGSLVSPPAAGRAVVLRFADAQPSRDEPQPVASGH